MSHEGARAAFVAAWALHPHWTIAGNLGATELKLGLYRDAAERLALYAREIKKDKQATAKQLEQAETMYAEARTKVGTVVVRANVKGAEVYVDGAPVGKEPLVDPVFVKPGEHIVEARADGYWTARETVTPGAGSQQKVVLELKAIKEEAEAPAPAQAAAPTPTQGPIAQTREQPSGGSGPRKEILIAGGAAAGAALVAGVVLTVVANGKASDAEDRAAALASTGVLCPRAVATADCLAVQDALAARDGLSNAAMWSFIGAGVLGAATVVYAVMAPRQQPQHVRVAPVVVERGAGLAIGGGF